MYNPTRTLQVQIDNCSMVFGLRRPRNAREYEQIRDGSALEITAELQDMLQVCVGACAQSKVKVSRSPRRIRRVYVQNLVSLCAETCLGLYTRVGKKKKTSHQLKITQRVCKMAQWPQGSPLGTYCVTCHKVIVGTPPALVYRTCVLVMNILVF